MPGDGGDAGGMQGECRGNAGGWRRDAGGPAGCLAGWGRVRAEGQDFARVWLKWSILVSMDVSIDFELPASVEEVWRAWTEPEIVLRWFGSSPTGVGLKAGLDVRVGGNFLVSFRDSMEHTCYGVYSVVDEPYRLGFSWNWKSEPGVTSQVVVSLEKIMGGTLMRFTHDKVGTKSAHDYKAGWTSTFEKLKRLLQG